MKIEPFRLTKEPLRELNAMMRQVAGWFAALEGLPAPLAEAIQQFQTLSEELNRLLFRDEGKAMQKMQAADRERIEAWRKLRAYAKAMTGHPDGAVADAAREVYQEILKQGNVAAVSQPERDTGLHLLLQIVGGMDEACRLLVLSEWLGRLQRGQDAYDMQLHIVSQQQGARQAGEIARLRYRLEQAYRTVCLRINAWVVYEGGEQFDRLISQLNALQNEHTRVRKFRQSMKENREDEKNGPEGGEDEKIA